MTFRQQKIIAHHIRYVKRHALGIHAFEYGLRIAIVVHLDEDGRESAKAFEQLPVVEVILCHLLLEEREVLRDGRHGIAGLLP